MWIMYAEYFHYFYPPQFLANSPRIPPTCLPLNFMLSFKIYIIKNFMSSISADHIAHVCGAIYRGTDSLRMGHYFKEKWFSLLQSMSTAKKSSASGGTLGTSPQSKL